jgi:hypothetical protein
MARLRVRVRVIVQASAQLTRVVLQTLWMMYVRNVASTAP